MNDRNRVAAATRDHRASIVGLVLVLAAGLMLSACNTTAGAGQDVSAAGKDVTGAARDVQNKL